MLTLLSISCLLELVVRIDNETLADIMVFNYSARVDL